MSDNAGTSSEVAVLEGMTPELVSTFAQMALLVPSETTDALDSIIGAILSAPSWENLADPWESKSAEKLAGKVFRIDSVTRRPSQIQGGLGVFLVVHCTDVRTREAFVFTTSSLSVVAQLVRAHTAGWLPLYAEIVIADRVTERGYRPHHLQFHATAG